MRTPGLGVAVVILMAAVSAAAAATQVELSPEQEARFLARMSTVPAVFLRGIPGMTPEAVSGILAFREKSGKFSSIQEFRKASGLTDEQYDQVAAPYSYIREFRKAPGPTDRQLDQPAAPRSRRAAGAADAPPGPRRGGKKEAMARRQGGDGGSAAAGVKEPPKDLGITIRPHYYSVLPGYDLSVITAEQRHAFLEKINTELCTCGCQNETLGYCLVNDPACPVVKARVRKIYMDIVGAPPIPPEDPGKR